MPWLVVLGFQPLLQPKMSSFLSACLSVMLLNVRVYVHDFAMEYRNDFDTVG